MSGLTDDTVVKTMTITRSEFERSLALLDARAHLDAAGSARVRSGDVAVSVGFEALSERTLGGLLRLPRARVTIAFDATTAARDRAAFLQRFDVAFQRGGG